MVRHRASLRRLAIVSLASAFFAPWAAGRELVGVSQMSSAEMQSAVPSGARVVRRVRLPNGYNRTVLSVDGTFNANAVPVPVLPMRHFRAQKLSNAQSLKRRLEQNASFAGNLSTQDVDWDDVGLWGLNRIRGFGASLGRTASVATASGQRKSRLCIVDSGIDKTHSRLKLPNGQSVVTQEFNFAWDPDLPAAVYRPSPTDATDDHEDPHGSHVAGIAAARDRFDGFSVRGVADGAVEIYNAKVIGAHRSGASYEYTAYDIDTALGILWCAGYSFENDPDFLSYYGVAPSTVPRADVINLSLGGPDDDDSLAYAIQYAQDLGITIVASAGNTYGDPILFPAAYPDVIAVGATDRMDAVADFSAHGTASRDIDVVAPGVDIVSSLTVENGSEYFGLYSGTSMSAPFVSGTVALQLATSPWRWTLSGADLGLPISEQGRLGLVQVPSTVEH